MVNYLTVTAISMSDIFILLKALIFIICLIALIFIGLIIYDYSKKYDYNKLFNSIQNRSGAKSYDGGEEIYLRYWLWQRNKRKYISSVLAYLTYDNRYFPKAKWKKKGRVKFPFRRECWINEHKVDREKYKEMLNNN